MNATTCRACGERLRNVAMERRKIRKTRNQPIVDEELDYCLDCADEMFFGVLACQRSLGEFRFGTRGGDRVIRSTRGLA
jgi:RNase P subunit RPR2